MDGWMNGWWKRRQKDELIEVINTCIKILTICIFVLVMFSTINGTAGGTLSPKAYSPNYNYQWRDCYNMYQLTRSVWLLWQHYIASKHGMTCYYYLSLKTHTHNQEAYQTIYSSLLRLIISYFLYLCLPEDWMKQDTSSK